MDETEIHRAQTLQVLEAFVENQKLLLARQRADIESLQRLKVDLAQRPAQLLSHFTEKLDGTEFHLSEQADCRLNLPKEIQWTSFRNTDIKPLQSFAQRTKIQSAPTAPLQTQRSSLSDLQKLVKHARRTIVDPILLRFESMSSPEPESEDGIDPVEWRREAERQKIIELKKRQIRGGLSLPLSSAAGEMGVFIRHEVDERAMDVEVSIVDGEGEGSSGVHAQPQLPSMPYATKAPPPLSSPPRPTPKTIKRQSVAKSSAKRKNGKPPDLRKRRKAPSPSPPPDADEYASSNAAVSDSDASDADSDTSLPRLKSKSSRSRAARPKPETYKQAWSASEQNLLEQLLDEIPESERFRWQKISQAMGGRRTPRQVASRVQKYFEKLRKFSLL